MSVRVAGWAERIQIRRGARELWRDWAELYSATLVGQLVAAGRSLLVARFLGPEQLGLWKSLQLVLSYTQWSDCGAIAGMGREVPLLRGRGRPEEMLNVQRVALSLTVVPSVAIGAAIAAYGVWGGERATLASGLIALAPVLISGRLLYYLFELSNARRAFRTTSRGTALLAILDGVLAPVAAWTGGFVPLMYTIAWANAAVIVYMARSLGFSWRFGWSLQAVGRLVSTGFGIALANVIFDVLRASDRLIVVAFVGTGAVGLYGLAIIAFDLCKAIPVLLGQVLLSHGAERYGRDGSPAQLFRDGEEALGTVGWLMPMALVTAWGLLPTMTRMALPAYAEGIGAARVLLWGTTFLSAHAVASVTFVTLGRLGTLVLLRLAGAIVGLASCSGAIWAGTGLTGVAGAMVGTYAFLSAAEFVAAGVICGRTARSAALAYLRIHAPAAAAGVGLLTLAGAGW